MAIIDKYNPGEFCWTDLGVTDVRAAKKFYQNILSCDVTDFPMGEGMYSVLRVKNRDVCAIYQKMNAAPGWLPYISVSDVDETLRKVQSLGGKTCAAAKDVMDKGRMAKCQDPTGGNFAIWQPKSHQGAGLDETPGTICWRDLNTDNPDVAGGFYAKVFGWVPSAEKMGEGVYHMFSLKEDPVGGMWPTPMKNMAPGWLTYWTVENCENTIAAALKMSGQLLLKTTPIPDMGKFAILADNQGVAFGVFESK